MAKKSDKPTTAGKIDKTAEKSPRGKTRSPQAVPGAFRLATGSLRFLARNWKVFLGTVLIYGALSTVLVKGFDAGNLNEIKTALDEFITDSWGELAGGFTLFTYLLGTSGNSTSPTAGIYQVTLGVIASLAIIWTLRQLHAGHAVRVRDGFYRGMTPIIPFVLVILVIVLQLLPLAIGTLLYSTVTANGIAATLVEQLLWATLAVVLAAVSLRLVSSSLFAAYIVTLPDMTPMAALRSARQLVRGRRWMVLRKTLFLPAAMLVTAALILVPLIMFATPLAAWVFYAMTMLVLPVAHSYMYSLYRSML